MRLSLVVLVCMVGCSDDDCPMRRELDDCIESGVKVQQGVYGRLVGINESTSADGCPQPAIPARGWQIELQPADAETPVAVDMTEDDGVFELAAPGGTYRVCNALSCWTSVDVPGAGRVRVDIDAATGVVTIGTASACG